MEWKVAFPLHPEYRTLPMVWYVPPLSPIQSAAEAGKMGSDGAMPDVRSLRIPLKYLANLLTAGDEEPVALGLERMLAMRAYMRAKTIDGVIDEAIAAKVGLTGQQIEDMYQIMAIANYEDRFVIPTAHRELGEDAYDLRGACGFSFGNGCSDGRTETGLFGGTKRKSQNPDGGRRDAQDAQGALRAAHLSDGRAAGGGPARCARRSTGKRACRSATAIALDRLLDELATGDLYDLQERYVLLFDRTRSLSLHLFEHVHGESRDRGQAMVDLKALYERHGLLMSSSELPDHLPLFLEFLSDHPRGRGCGAARGDGARPGGDPPAAEEAQGGVFVGLLLRPGAGRRQAASRRRGGPDGRAGRGPQRPRRPRRGLGGGRGHLRSCRRAAAQGQRPGSPPSCARAPAAPACRRAKRPVPTRPAPEEARHARLHQSYRCSALSLRRA